MLADEPSGHLVVSSGSSDNSFKLVDIEHGGLQRKGPAGRVGGALIAIIANMLGTSFCDLSTFTLKEMSYIT
jgi:hypothetical protein